MHLLDFIYVQVMRRAWQFGCFQNGVIVYSWERSAASRETRFGEQCGSLQMTLYGFPSYLRGRSLICSWASTYLTHV